MRYPSLLAVLVTLSAAVVLGAEPLAPFTETAPGAPALHLALDLTTGMPDGVVTPNRWESGLRDEGTSDTRPRMSVARAAWNGQDALRMEVWYPNSREMFDLFLPKGKTGTDWSGIGADYLSFRYRTDALAGDMVVRLNDGRLRWGKNVKSFIAEFPVRPSAEWQEVLLPFSAFVTLDRKNEVDTILTTLDAIDVVSVGYENHRLQGPGTIEFVDFQVGTMPTTRPSSQPVSLAGPWRFQLDNHRPDGTKSDFGKSDKDKERQRDREGYGKELGWASPDFDDSAWPTITVPATWESQGHSYDGPAWYRAQVVVPERWRGLPLTLDLGRPDDRGTAYWNGEAIQTVTKFGPHFQVTLQPEQILYGKVNSIAVNIHDWYRSGGLNAGSFGIGPVPAESRVAVTMEWQDDPASSRPTAEFEMGAKPPTRARALSLRASFQSDLPPPAGAYLEYRLVDCFHRQIAAGRQPVAAADATAGVNVITARVDLTQAEARQLYYSEWFDANLVLRAADGSVLDASCPRTLKLKYAERDALALPALPPQVDETPYGALPLVDLIRCGDADTDTPHPYKEGGIRASWVSTRAYATWKQGVTVGTLGDETYREANNNEFFGYRIGRGQLKPHTAYLLRLKVPDDKARYTVVDIKAGRNYQGSGYRAGTGPDDPWGNYPQSGEMQWYDHLVFLDDTTYGYQGARSTSAENGFWVFLHDNGRVYTGQYEAGPAVAEMRLYELGDIAAHYPTIRYPEGQPHRTLMMDWERQPEAPPADVARWAHFAGLNVIAPVFQKWASHAFWHSETGYEPPGWYRVLAEDEDDRDVYQMWLDATREHGIGFMPRIEYGGGPKLPKEARIIAPNGKIDPCGRYCQWGANILHDATWAELQTVMQELIGNNIAANPQIVGLLWRQRQDRIKPSYGPADIALFQADTGLAPPAGTAPDALAKWASTTVGDAYLTWWQGKRAEFLRRTRDQLKAFRPDLLLAYYNWDQDGWKLGFSKNAQNTAQDWSDLYNVDQAPDYWKRVMAKLATNTPADYVEMLETQPKPNDRIYPTRDFSAAVDPVGDIAVFAPLNGRHLADNPEYVNYFQTADGLAVCHQFDYEEKARWNIQGDNYESSELTPGGHAFGMAEEVLACFHGDPNVITWTTYTYGRGWLDVHRRFAQAFLALPDRRGEVLPDAVASPASADLRVRVYRDGERTWVGVVHRGLKPASFTIRIPAAAGTVTDLVTGATLPGTAQEGDTVFTVQVGAMELNSYLIAP